LSESPNKKLTSSFNYSKKNLIRHFMPLNGDSAMNVLVIVVHPLKIIFEKNFIA